ncbi:MAG: hypothetical protein NVSMB7_00790 [Chitinophagaceae bacterium]
MFMQTLFFILAMYILPLVKPVSYHPGHNTADMIIQTGSKKNRDTSLNGKWFLQPLLAADTAAGKIPFLQINLSAGSFMGNTGCNSMRGSFRKTDTSLVFNQNMITTKMICTGYDEAAFIKSLLHTNRYKIEKGILILMFDATELSRWTRKPDKQIKTNKA